MNRSSAGKGVRRKLRTGMCISLCLPLLAGCSGLGYYWQSVSGHVALMQAARPVQDWLADPQADESLKARLALAQSIRRYAVRELHLPNNASYQRYADLHRTAVVWNVSAAPASSLKPVKWCFAVAGCVSYKGFFDHAQAEAEATQLRAQGLEVSVYPVPAYSTLGRLNWAGGDPLLNTFIHEPDAELAGLIFHELAHQVAYAADDTAFNESFASAVEKLGRQRWLRDEASPEARARQARVQPRRAQFRALVQDLRRDLQATYGESDLDVDADADLNAKADTLPDQSAKTNASRPLSAAQLTAKADAYQRFHRRYAAIKADWPDSPPQWDRWVQGLNNAALSSGASYERWGPAFDTLFKLNDEDWGRFYAEVRQLAALPKTQRQQQLKKLSQASMSQQVVNADFRP